MKSALFVSLAFCGIACARGDVGTDIGSGGFTVHEPAHTPSEPAASASSEPGSGETTTPKTSTTPPPPPSSTEVHGSYSLDATCSDLPILEICVLPNKADKDVPFMLPAGMKRSSIAFSITPHGPDASGSADWASNDPLDATVHMHASAGPFSSVHVEVTGVVAVPDE
jgi:hypothetical protein